MNISVVIPCHNAVKWLPFALESVFSQTKKPFEVILVDDDSSDNLTEALGVHAASVKLIHIRKRNAAAARNEGIRAATGDWIALLDADDVWNNSHLERGEEFLKTGHEVAYIANHDWIDLNGRPMFMPDWFVHPARGSMRNLKPDDYFELVSHGFHFCHSTVIYARSLVAKVGLFDEQQLRRHDLELWLRVISNGDWAYDSRKSAGYRVDTPGSISKNELECDYFELLALQKFRKKYDSKAFKTFYQSTARRALGIAIASENPHHYHTIYALAKKELGFFKRLFYFLAGKFYSAFAFAYKLKNNIKKYLGSNVLYKIAILIAKKTDSCYWKHVHYDVNSQAPANSLGSDTTCCMGFYADGVFNFEWAAQEPASAIIEFKMAPRLDGLFLNPCIHAEQPGIRTIESYVRGSGGAQFLNATSFHKNAQGNHLMIRAKSHGIKILEKQARLHVSRTRIRSDESVVVFGPHPDDSEIAAFGLYSDSQAKVVNISCGEATDRFNGLPENLQIPKVEIAKFRLLDSLYAPRVGGVKAEDIANFCYPDGYLKEMYMQPSKDFTLELDYNFSSLREKGAGPLLAPAGKVSWEALVNDIRHCLRKCQPTLIVCPHPRLDCHDDHFFTTLAIFEAIKVENPVKLSFFFYTNHNMYTELWPFGHAGAAFSPLPCFFDDGVAGDGFHFHPLNEQRRLQKAIALEIMHDIRDIHFFEPRPVKTKLRQIRSQLHAIFHRMGVPPTSYQRRAPRPYEFFITASRITGERIMAEALKARGSKVEDSHS
jgi:glycosyltransferase involved in cell wall biosynthesis/LmbE family N-acetylglucosaminyl deacetylase